MGNNQPSARKKTYYISLAILAGMFFIFGFVSWVNSILIPYFRISCELTPVSYTHLTLPTNSRV